MVKNTVVTEVTAAEIRRELDSCGLNEKEIQESFNIEHGLILIDDSQNTIDWFKRYLPQAKLKKQCRSCKKLNDIKSSKCHNCGINDPTEPYDESYD